MFGKKKLIEGLKKKLSDTEAELKASKDLLVDSQEDLKDFQKQAFATKSELLSSLESKEAELKSLAENNKLLKATADAAQKEKADFTSKLQSLESSLASVKADLAAKEAEVAKLGDTLKLKDEEIAKSKEALKSFQDLAAEKEAKFQEAEKTLKKFEEMVKNNEVTSGGIEAGLASFNAANLAVDDKIAEAKKKLDDAMVAVKESTTYNVAFVADGEVISKAVMASEADADKIPAIPAKEGFDAEWQYEDVGDNDIIVTAVYTPKEYDLMYFVDDVKYAEVKAPKDEISAIPVPEREDYEGEWVATLIDGNSARIDALYKPVKYKLQFFVDGAKVCEAEADAESGFQAPEVPYKEDYDGEWQYEPCEDGIVKVEAVYTPIVYDLVFFVDDVKYAEVKASADEVSGIPPVPEKEDYDGEWVYTAIDGNSARIDAFYTPKVYNLKFYVDGEEYAETTACEGADFAIPEVPEREDFKGEWYYEKLDDGTVRLDAVYVPTAYDLLFFVDDQKYAQMKVATDEDIDLPAVPEKEDYIGEWAYTVMGGNAARIDAMYTPIKYKLQFFADGAKVCEAEADAESGFQAPEVPYKEDYDGEWQYEPCKDGVVRVEAVYTPTEYDIVFFVDDVKYNEMKMCPALGETALPAVPEKEGFSGQWAYTVIDGNSARVDAVYTPLGESDGERYHVTFYVDGKKYMEKDLASDADLDSLPPVPIKDDYVGRWEYTETGEDTADVVAVYEPIEYNMIFYVDGEKYAEAVMTVEDDPSVVPKVPEKPGFTGEWHYSKEDDTVIVTAVYTAE
ncbi:MAG: hypothetical protein IKH39_01305 [Candidatus Methanomethylophilaceae archaeon]|nr:hypothetical protein [Candidatus Methanomethylophilaceae archaeon]